MGQLVSRLLLVLIFSHHCLYSLFTGTQDGRILAYDTRTFALTASYQDVDAECVNSVVCHPLLSALLYCTGQRHFVDDDDDAVVPASCLKSIGCSIQCSAPSPTSKLVAESISC